MRTLLLIVVAGWSGPAFAEQAPLDMRIGLRTGVEGSSTVRLAKYPMGHMEELLTLGLDAETFSERYFVGGGVVVAAAAPFGHSVLRGSLHAGTDTALASVRMAAKVELGMQWLGHICPGILRTDPCGSSALPFAGLRGEVGYAFEHVEVAVWSSFLVDLGRDHVTSGNEYKIGGFTLGGGLSVAYVRRRSNDGR